MKNIIKNLLLCILTKLNFVQPPDLTVKQVSEHPIKEKINTKTIFIVGGKGYQKWAYLRCPCGCNEIIMLSLVKKRRPNWNFSTDLLNRPTIYPSIWQTSGCRSHFWVKKGSVNWCKNTIENSDLYV